MQIFLEQIDIIKRLVANYPDDMQMVVTAQGNQGLISHKARQMKLSIGFTTFSHFSLSRNQNQIAKTQFIHVVETDSTLLQYS